MIGRSSVWLVGNPPEKKVGLGQLPLPLRQLHQTRYRYPQRCTPGDDELWTDSIRGGERKGPIPEIIHSVDGRPTTSFMTEAMGSSPVMVYCGMVNSTFWDQPCWTRWAAREKNAMQGHGSEEPCPPVRAPSQARHEDGMDNPVGPRINTVEPSLKIVLYCKVNCSKRLATCKPDNRHGLPRPTCFIGQRSACATQRKDGSEIQRVHHVSLVSNDGQ